MYRNGLEFNKQYSPAFQEALKVVKAYEPPKKVPARDLVLARIIKEL